MTYLKKFLCLIVLALLLSLAACGKLEDKLLGTWVTPEPDEGSSSYEIILYEDGTGERPGSIGTWTIINGNQLKYSSSLMGNTIYDISGDAKTLTDQYGRSYIKK